MVLSLCISVTACASWLVSYYAGGLDLTIPTVQDGSVIAALLAKLDCVTRDHYDGACNVFAIICLTYLVVHVLVECYCYVALQDRYDRALGAVTAVDDESGVFVRGGKRVFRDVPHGPAMELLPKEVVRQGDVFKVVYDFGTAQQASSIMSESVLPSGYRPIPITKSEAPKGLVMISSGGEQVGMGGRIGNLLLTARHVGDTSGELRVGLPQLNAPTLPLSMAIKVHHLTGDKPPSANYEHTGRDIVAYEFEPSFWTKLGVSSFSPKQLSKNCNGNFRAFTFSSEGLVKTEGYLVSDARREKREGLLSHSASTIAGFSGSPMVGRVNGVEKLFGLHIAGGNDTGKNYGVTIWSIMRLLEVAGVSTKTAYGKIASLLQNESHGSPYYDKEPKQEQYENWYDDPELEELNSSKFLDQSHDNFMARGEENGATEDLSRKSKKALKGPSWADMMDEARVLFGQVTSESKSPDDFLAEFKTLLTRFAEEEPPCKSPAMDVAERRKHVTLKESLAKSEMNSHGRVILRNPRAAKGRATVPWRVDGPPNPASLPLPFGMVSESAAPKGCPRDIHRPYTSCWPEDTSNALLKDQEFWSVNDQDRSNFAKENEPRACKEDVYKWMVVGETSALAALTNVGIDAIRDERVFDKYWDYVDSGKMNKFDPADQRTLDGGDGKPIANCIGQYPAKFNASAKKTRAPTQQQIDALEKAGVRMGTVEDPEFVLPPHGASEVLASLEYQLKRVKRTSSWEEIKKRSDSTQRILTKLAKEYPRTSTGITDFPKLIDKLIDHLDGERSSGFSAMYLPGQKQAWKDDPDQLKYMVTARLALRVAAGDKIHHYTPEEMIAHGLKDPEVLQIKEEPHKKKKAVNKRWRLIWLSSVVDVVVQMVSHFTQNKADIASYQDGHLKSQTMGMGHSDEGIECLGEVIEHMTESGKLRLKYEDVSGWDIGVLRDMWYFDAEARCICLKPGEHRALEETLLWAEAAISSVHVVVIGNYVWTIHTYGIMGSGVYSTSATNCRGRTAELQACGAKYSTALGDDALYTGEVDKEMFATLGHVMDKDEVGEADPKGPVSFTSHSYEKKDGVWTAQFEQIDKMLVKLVLTAGPAGPKPDQVAGCKFAIRHTPSAQLKFNGIVEEQGWTDHVAAVPEGVQ